jgi:hypothetical protein
LPILFLSAENSALAILGGCFFLTGIIYGAYIGMYNHVVMKGLTPLYKTVSLTPESLKAR